MSSRQLLRSAWVAACFGLVAVPAHSADPFIKDTTAAPSKHTKASYAPQESAGSLANRAGIDADALIFTAAPRESVLDGQKIYGPVVEYLSKTLGRKVVYRHPGTWGAYRSEMLKGNYDIVFDGPHFNSYRAEKLGHNILVKLPGRHEFAIIVRKNEKFNAVSQMGGRTFCTHAPPNLGALVLLSQFDNPARQPSIIPVDGWNKIYEGVAAGRCAGGILPIANLKKLDTKENMRIVYKTTAMPNQAFSAGPRLSREEQAKLAAALTDAAGAAATDKLRAAFKAEQFMTTTNAEYVGIAQYLRSEWGYY